MAAPNSITVCSSLFFGIHQIYSIVLHPQPPLCSSKGLQKFLATYIERKIIQPLGITLLSKNGLFFLLFIREGNFLIWFLEETLAVFSVKGVLLGDYTGAVVQGHEATSVGVHAASLIIPHALL